MFDHTSFASHEGVHAFHDPITGLRCVIAVHSTRLGPAAGGCRMWDYSNGEAMVTDALRLSQGMSYKNAMAGLDHGGGKAVIWGNPRRDKSRDLFMAFGRCVHSLQGKYYTAEDVGVDVGDIEAAALVTPYAAGRSSGAEASGDPSPVTALGVFKGIEEGALRAFGSRDLSGRSVAVQGLGSVGGHLARHLAKAGADLILTDIDEALVGQLAAELGARTCAPDEIFDTGADIFSPNALGAVLNPSTLPRLSAKLIAGGANNQLATPAIGLDLHERGVLYAPDYVINGGGIINVAAEIRGDYERAWVMDKLEQLSGTLGRVFDRALESGRPTSVVADEMAEDRIRAGRPGL